MPVRHISSLGLTRAVLDDSENLLQVQRARMEHDANLAEHARVLLLPLLQSGSLTSDAYLAKVAEHACEAGQLGERIMAEARGAVAAIVAPKRKRGRPPKYSPGLVTIVISFVRHYSSFPHNLSTGDRDRIGDAFVRTAERLAQNGPESLTASQIKAIWDNNKTHFLRG